MKGEESFATIVIAVEECEACKGNAVGPEPVDGLGDGVGEVVLVNCEGVVR